MFQRLYWSTTSDCLEWCQIILSSAVCSSGWIFFSFSCCVTESCVWLDTTLVESAIERRNPTRCHTRVPHLKGFVKILFFFLENVFFFPGKKKKTENISCKRFEEFQGQYSSYKLFQPAWEGWLLQAIPAVYDYYEWVDYKISWYHGTRSHPAWKVDKEKLTFIVTSASYLTRTSPSTYRVEEVFI